MIQYDNMIQYSISDTDIASVLYFKCYKRRFIREVPLSPAGTIVFEEKWWGTPVDGNDANDGEKYEDDEDEDEKQNRQQTKSKMSGM